MVAARCNCINNCLVNINIISQKFSMQTQQKIKTSLSLSQISATQSPWDRPLLIAFQGPIVHGKTVLSHSLEKQQKGTTSAPIYLAEDLGGHSQKLGVLLPQSPNCSTNTPIKTMPLEWVSSPKDKIETEEQFINKVIAEEQKNKQAFEEVSLMRNRKMQQEAFANQEEAIILPIASIVKINNLNRVVECRSSESDNNSQHQTKISKNHQIATLLGQSFQSQYISEDDQTLTKCENCEVLQQKTMSIMAENNQYVNKINILIKKCSILRSRPNSPINMEIPESDEGIQSSGNVQSFSDYIKNQVKAIQNALNQIKSPGFYEVLDFNVEDKKAISELSQSLKQLLSILQQGKDNKHQQEIKIITIVHEAYRKRLEQMKESYQQKIAKMRKDFQKFMQSMAESQDIFTENPTLFSQQKVPKKGLKRKMNSMSIEREEIKDDLMHLRERLEHLEYTNQEEKKKIRILERQNKLLAQKYSQEIAELKNQKSYFASLAKKYQVQFEDFMQKATNSPSFSKIYYQQFFKDISQRMFQISNCIPFEENDQQNLFAAENQQQLFEMIERIRRFSLQIEEYYAEKDKEFCNLKKGVTMFVKRLLQTQKITLKQILEVIKNSKDLQLDYLRDFLVCLKKKKSKYEEVLGQSKKKQTKRKSLTLEKVDSLTFLSDEAHRNSQSQ